MVAGSQDARRLQALDGLRGLAALGIVMVHVWMYDFGDGGRQPRWFGDHLVEGFRLGVPLFFLMSGFLLYRPFVAALLERRALPSVRKYALRRVARVGPAYWVTVLVAFLLMGALGHAYAARLVELPMFLLFMQNYFSATAKELDPPMWTLVVEASFYALLPLIVGIAWLLGARRWRQAALCLALYGFGITMAEFASAHDWPWTATQTLLTMMPAFAAGMLVAVVVHGRALSARAGWLLVLVGWALVIGDVVVYAYRLGTPELRIHLRDQAAIVGFALIVAGYVAAPVRARILNWRPVEWLGTVSLGLYLWHYIVIVLLRESGLWPAAMGSALLLTWGLGLALAALSWHLIELPAMRWARGQRPQRAPQPARARVATADST